MPAASRQEGRAGDGPRAWPNGPGGPGPARRGGDTFLLNSPRFPTGAGGGPNTKPGAQRPTACSCEAASPPGDHWGAERPSWRAGRPPTRPGRPGPSTADLAAGMTSAAGGGPAAGAGRHRNGRARGSPRAVGVTEPVKSVRVSGSCPRPNDDVRRSPASCRLDSFKGARPRPEEVGKRSALPRAWASEGVPSAARSRRRSPAGSSSPATPPAAGTRPAERRHDAPSVRRAVRGSVAGRVRSDRAGRAGGGDPRGPARHRPARSDRVSVCRGQEARRTGQGWPEARSPRRASPSGSTAWPSPSWSRSWRALRAAAGRAGTGRPVSSNGPGNWNKARYVVRSSGRLASRSGLFSE